MTSFSWFSGSRESSRNCMVSPRGKRGPGSDRSAADDARPLHLPGRGPVIRHRVMLGGAVIPDRHAAGRPAPTDLVFGDRGAPDQVIEQVGGARREVLA